MTRKIMVITLLVSMMFLLCGCSHPLAKQVSNTKAYIKIDDKMIIVDVDAYTQSSNGVVIVYGIDGKTYKTHFMNVVLVENVEGR